MLDAGYHDAWVLSVQVLVSLQRLNQHISPFYLTNQPTEGKNKKLPLSTMKSGDENNLVPISNLVLQLPFKLPVGIINQDQNTWPPKKNRQNQPLNLVVIHHTGCVKNPKIKKRTRRPPPQTSLPAHLTSSPSSI